MQIEIKDQKLNLLPEKAVLWENEFTLIISDLHIGKLSFFRKEGVPVPLNGVEKNFQRLNHLLKNHNIERIIFTGDLFHGNENTEWHLFSKWRKDYSSVEMRIVLGNHDLLPSVRYTDAEIAVDDCDLLVDPFRFCHHPVENPPTDTYTICGHVHPVFNIQGLASQNLRLPCFAFGQHQAILPSFGYFTGGYNIEREDFNRIFVIADSSVVEVK